MADYVGVLVWITIAIIVIAILFLFIIILYNALRVISIKKLEYRRYFSEEGVFEDEELYLIEELANHSFIPMINADVESHISSQIKLEGCEDSDDVNQYFISRFTVMPFTTIKRKHKARALKRGYYELESAKVDFAGMDLYLESKAELYVYPKEVKIDSIENKNLYLKYDEVSLRPLLTDVFSFAGIRSYVVGDAFNSINFKASARQGQWMVNDKGYMMGRQIQMYLNFQMPEKGMDLQSFAKLMEEAITYISYIIGEGMRKGYKVGLSTNSRMVNGNRYLRFKMSTGISYYQELLRELALIRIMFGNSFPSIIDMDIDDHINNSEVYIFTTYLDQSIDQKISILQQFGNTVKTVILEV